MSTPTLTFRLSNDQRDRLETMRIASGAETQSDLLRQLIEEAWRKFEFEEALKYKIAAELASGFRS